LNGSRCKIIGQRSEHLLGGEKRGSSKRSSDKKPDKVMYWRGPRSFRIEGTDLREG